MTYLTACLRIFQLGFRFHCLKVETKQQSFSYTLKNTSTIVAKLIPQMYFRKSIFYVSLETLERFGLELDSVLTQEVNGKAVFWPSDILEFKSCRILALKRLNLVRCC